MSKIDEMAAIIEFTRDQVAENAMDVAKLREELAEAEMVFTESVKQLRYRVSVFEDAVAEATAEKEPGE